MLYANSHPGDRDAIDMFGLQWEALEVEQKEQLRQHWREQQQALMPADHTILSTTNEVATDAAAAAASDELRKSMAKVRTLRRHYFATWTACCGAVWGSMCSRHTRSTDLV